MKMVKPIIEELNYFPDPVSVYSALREEPYSAFLDSGMDEKKLGRFSFIGYNPFMVAQCKGEDITVFTEDGTDRVKDNPFNFLKKTLSYYRTEPAGHNLPFTSGCIGYFSYDLRYFIEKLPYVAVDDINMPDFILCFYDVIIIFDNLRKRAYIASSGLPLRDGKRNRERAKNRLEATKLQLDKIPAGDNNVMAETNYPAQESDSPESSHEISSNVTREDYYKAIDRAKELIARGDIYQVNLSQRLECDFEGDAFELYMRLRKINPAPFAAYLDFDKFKIVSASPERFAKIDGRHIETRPIKGTRPRSSDGREDLLLKQQLLSSAKDRAEHVMIVDLERNDLGRICEYGTVVPTEFIIVESYATVHHLVSTVSGRLREGMGAVDFLMNCFPGGSITGAPKVRSMEVIEELEPVKRGIYTGSIGYIDFCGNADFSIVIRTIIIKRRKAYFQVGGGIVADSVPEKEYQETLDKARALMQAVRIQKSISLQSIASAKGGSAFRQRRTSLRLAG
jgi:para-aminobenzoate synthetase component 1